MDLSYFGIGCALGVHGRYCLHFWEAWMPTEGRLINFVVFWEKTNIRRSAHTTANYTRWNLLCFSCVYSRQLLCQKSTRVLDVHGGPARGGSRETPVIQWWVVVVKELNYVSEDMCPCAAHLQMQAICSTTVF